MNRLVEFLGKDDGAVTIDWVALTAATVLMGIFFVYAIFETSVTELPETINTGVSSVNALDPTVPSL